jgi:hypothetical protein
MRPLEPFGHTIRREPQHQIRFHDAAAHVAVDHERNAAKHFALRESGTMI